MAHKRHSLTCPRCKKHYRRVKFCHRCEDYECPSGFCPSVFGKCTCGVPLRETRFIYWKDGKDLAVEQEAAKAILKEAFDRMVQDVDATRCKINKMGEFNMLRCCRQEGHNGACNFVIVDRV